MIRTQKELSQTTGTHHGGGRVYALQGKKINGKPIGQLLIHMGIIEPEVLTRALRIQTGVPMVDLLFIHILPRYSVPHPKRESD